jgi:hypothetical protein
MTLQQLRAAEILIAVWGSLCAVGFGALVLIALLGDRILNVFFW